jgi:predicted nucleotidyltransferase
MRFVSEWSVPGDAVEPETLRTALESYPLEIAILFGSHASESVDHWSDLDLAVAFESAVSTDDRRRLLDEITVPVTDTTGFEAIDLVDLDAAGPHLGYEICSEGILVLGEEETATEWESQFLVKKIDFEPIKREWREAMDDRLESGEYGRA